MLRSPARRLHRSGRSAATPGVASGRLRQRVLGTVRNETTADTGRRARAPSLSSLAAIAATAAIAAAVAFAVSQSRSARGPSADARPAPGVQAPRAALHDTAGHSELVVSGMPEPPIGEVYEVWLNTAGTPPHPTDALFTVTSAGNGSVEVPGSLHGVREVMVTSEPLGGSSSPTSLAVLRVRVPRVR